MKAAQIAKVALIGLFSHAFRSFLATLGVVLGVGAVVGMMAISEGARRESLDQIKAQGIDNIVVHSVKPAPGSSGSQPAKNSSWVETYGIEERDIRHVLNSFDNVRIVVPVRHMRQEVYREGKVTDVQIVATTPDFLRVTRSGLIGSRSRFLSEQDRDRLNAVCVLGKTAARTLMGFRDPIKRSVSVGGASFEVIGVLENEKGTRLAGVHDLNNLIYIPLETANALYGRLLLSFADRKATRVDADYLYIAVQDVTQIGNTAARLRTYLHESHENLDYRIQVPYELLKQKEETQRIFTIVMASIAAISLLVGGIGIMNIMLANIYERTREIGTRRALGAKKRDILIQFLMESVALTAIGGGVGLGLGAVIAALVQTCAGMRTNITSVSILISLTVAVITGVTFGTYPAWKAANLDPIVALRHE